MNQVISLGKSFTSLSQLEAYLQTKIKDALNKEVAENVKEEIQTAVSERIYQSGTPEIYVRRGGNQYGGMGNSLGTGSLGDPNEIHHTVNAGILEVTDEAKSKMPWDRDLSEAMIHGYGDKSQWFNEERDFLETARENMREDKSFVEAMRDGLIRQGLIVV